MSIQEMVSSYEEIRPRYQRLAEKLSNLLYELLISKGIKPVFIEERAKTVESFESKISRPDKTYSDPLSEVTDFAGVRVIVQSLDDIKIVESVIENEFEVDESKSVRKADTLDPDRFGYLSNHFVIKISKPRNQLAEWSSVNNMWAEIQVRTVLQHAWALISHTFDYKNGDEVPKEIRRELFRVSALLEVADNELNSFIQQASTLRENYIVRISSEDKDLDLNVDSLRVFLETSNIVDDWARIIEKIGVKVGGIGAISRDVKMANFVGIETINSIREILIDAKIWGEDFLREFFINTWGGPLPSSGISLDRNGIVTIFLIASYLEYFTDDILNNRFGWGLPERATVPARKYNPKYKSNGD